MPRRITSLPLIWGGRCRDGGDEGEPERESGRAVVGDVEDRLDRRDSCRTNAPKDQRLHQDRELHLPERKGFDEKASRSGARRKGRRIAAGRVSGWRSISHPTDSSEKIRNARKIARQPNPQMMAAPIIGATAGKMVKISIAKLTICAICRPAWRSRDDRHGNHARPRGAQALQDARGQQQLERRRDPGQQRTDDVEGGPAEDHGLAAETCPTGAR